MPDNSARSENLRPVPPLLPSRGVSRRSLAQSLEATDRHPVLIFGASNAGKSTLIVSMIQALEESGEVAVNLGDPVLDRSDPRSEERHRAAQSLYEREAFRVEGGLAVTPTKGDPFFVPVDVKPKNSRLEPVRFAFLDARGEGFEPNDEQSMELYKPFSEDVREVLTEFPRGVSILYVAPYSIGSGRDRDTLTSNFALAGTIQGYEALRLERRNDFHLFLMTKWDQFAPPLHPNGKFEAPSPEDVDEQLRERYAKSWGKFQALPLEGPAHHRRTFLQYSAGYFRNGHPTRPSGDIAAAFARYPRTLLNWLYGNATEAHLVSSTASLVARRILFEDVVAASEPRITMTERLASWLTAR